MGICLVPSRGFFQKFAGGSLMGIVVVAGASFSVTSSAEAQGYRGMSCGQLWYERNRIFARRGHCFRSARARRAFGRNCFPPFGRLRRWERREVNRIERWEYRKGCR